MGSCASADKSRPGPPMKLVAFGTRADSLVNPESPKEVNSAPLSNPPETAPDDGGVPVKSRPSFCSAEKSLESPGKENSVPVDSPTAEDRPVKSRRWSFSSAKKSFGSKGETFFDSQAWLESDDEFHSVNGDFTPSRGNTPKNSFSERLPRVHNLLFEEKPRSPLLRRKKLGELFRDSIREEREDSSEGSPENQRERSERSSSAGDTPRASGANSSAIDDDSANKREKGLKSANGCLPGFVSCGSFSEKRKKMIPAAVAVK
ncbi:PREDICTED: uncharacterized protein At3g27210-like isoform X1 [Tarenaya hassleriana]|uniref:uncharacterized protein At3g27210-like isoform X1 n=1 Tax=Tarenaya hassleriana TaxID=28532 RepID=UPI00053C4323|nr:PREDICTED: uncharacterized protein At3g27210-like isoform X1 [Tarenaya hassleriana]